MLSVSAAIIFYNDFNYNTTYAVNGISFYKPTGNFPSNPQYSVNLSSNAAGLNMSNEGGGSGHSVYIYSDLASAISDGVFQSSFNVNFERGTGFDVIYRNTGFTSDYFNIQFNAGNIKTYENTGDIADMEICDFNTTTTYTYHIIFNYDVATKKYNLLISTLNGTTLFSCIDKTITTTSNMTFNAFTLRYNFNAYEDSQKFIDNFLIEYISSNYTYVGEGFPCSIDNDCLSGFCQFSQCKLKTSMMSCSQSSQCVSGQCINSKCTMQSLGQGIVASKNEWFGNDSITNNLIAIIILIMVTLVCANSIGKYSQNGIFTGIMSIGIFFICGIFLTILGWLSVFFLLALFVMILLIVMTVIFLGSGGQ